MYNLINNLEDRMGDKKHFKLDTSAEELIKHFVDDLQCKIPAIFLRKII